MLEMFAHANPNLPCFIQSPQTAIDQLKLRLSYDKKLNKNDCAQLADRLIWESYGNWRTVFYDRYQYCC